MLSILCVYGDEQYFTFQAFFAMSLVMLHFFLSRHPKHYLFSCVTLKFVMLISEKGVDVETVLTSRITSKGQVTIPAGVRKSLNIKTGSLVGFVPGENGTYSIKPIEQDSLDSLKGFLKYSGPPVSLEDMDKAIAQAALERLET